MYPRRRENINFVVKGDAKGHIGIMYTEAKHPRKVLWRCFKCNEVYKNTRISQWWPMIGGTSMERNCTSEP